MKPEVTIGICARNSEKTLAYAIESVIAQDFPHELIEILFVDDGSKDDTLKIMKMFASKMDIRSKIFSSEWRGLGKARNTVIDNAEGDYIVWLDSDEILDKSFLTTQISLLNQNPNAGIATAALRMVTSGSLLLSLDMIPALVEYNTQDWTSPAKLPGTGGATYKVIAAKQVGGFDEDLSGSCEDIDIAYRIRQKGWSIIRGGGKFYETHGNLTTVFDLWRRYSNQGRYSRRLYKKNSVFFSLYRMNPIAGFLAGLLYVYRGYKLTNLGVAFLLPFQFFVKMTAWFTGFTKT
jgi:glycosyltransferase involved in cell wall biosynthesis